MTRRGGRRRNRNRPMPPKPLRQPTRKEAVKLPQNAKFEFLSKVSAHLAREGFLDDAEHFGVQALKVALGRTWLLPYAYRDRKCMIGQRHLRQYAVVECASLSSFSKDAPQPVSCANRVGGSFLWRPGVNAESPFVHQSAVVVLTSRVAGCRHARGGGHPRGGLQALRVVWSVPQRRFLFQVGTALCVPYTPTRPIGCPPSLVHHDA